MQEFKKRLWVYLSPVLIHGICILVFLGIMSFCHVTLAHTVGKEYKFLDIILVRHVIDICDLAIFAFFISLIFLDIKERWKKGL